MPLKIAPPRSTGPKIVVCHIGTGAIEKSNEISANHSTATGAINTACRIAYQHLPLPLLFVCEDNGLGISVRTPEGWVRSAYGHRPRLRYFEADGCDPVAASEVAARRRRLGPRASAAPAFLHLRTVRLMGHAGADVEPAYRQPVEIGGDLARDPLRRHGAGCSTDPAWRPRALVHRYERIRAEVLALAEEVPAAPQLASAAE